MAELDRWMSRAKALKRTAVDLSRQVHQTMRFQLPWRTRMAIAEAQLRTAYALRIFADQVFFVRLCLRAPVYVHADALELYRLHPDSACARAADEDVYDPEGGPSIMHARYLDRLEAHLRADGVTDLEVWDALHRAGSPHRQRLCEARGVR